MKIPENSESKKGERRTEGSLAAGKNYAPYKRKPEKLTLSTDE